MDTPPIVRLSRNLPSHLILISQVGSFVHNFTLLRVDECAAYMHMGGAPMGATLKESEHIEVIENESNIFLRY